MTTKISDRQKSILASDNALLDKLVYVYAENHQVDNSLVQKHNLIYLEELISSYGKRFRIDFIQGRFFNFYGDDGKSTSIPGQLKIRLALSGKDIDPTGALKAYHRVHGEDCYPTYGWLGCFKRGRARAYRKVKHAHELRHAFDPDGLADWSRPKRVNLLKEARYSNVRSTWNNNNWKRFRKSQHKNHNIC